MKSTLYRLALLVSIICVAGCASLPPQAGRPVTHALTNTDDTRLGTQLSPSNQQHPGDTAFHLLITGVDAFVARIVLAETADRSVDLQYYIWHDDETGQGLAASLLAAADRGVRVRLVLDDLGTSADDEVLLALNSHPNIEIRLFNPVAARSFKKLGTLFEFSRVNRRMHNKAMIADNQAAILGGRNIGDEYFGASSSVAFSDLDVLLHGAVVSDISNEFDLFWNSDEVYTVESLVGHKAPAGALDAYRQHLAASVAAREGGAYADEVKTRLKDALKSDDLSFSWGHATLLFDDPTKITRSPNDIQGHLLTKFNALHVEPQHDMLVISPYFVPGDEGMAWMKGLEARGVDVTVLTNSLAATDVAAVHSGYSRYRMEMLEAGVHLFELKPVADSETKKKMLFGSSKASLHAKTYVFDRSSIFIGSMNLDPRSLTLNTEIGVYCEDPKIASQVVSDVTPQLNTLAWKLERRTDASGDSKIVWIENGPGGPQELTSDPDVSSFRRMEIWLLGLLPIESEL
ncbi:cardiolipin synthase C [Pararobbsia alpina]|uniref:phospholipase D family protein n=1 Tax=Pararobbsia alpina TaxID=621374 RepID=UPI0039A76089